MKKITILLIAMVYLTMMSCKHNSEHTHSDHEATEHEHDHESESIKLKITEYTDDFELFAEADPFVKDNSSQILAHFTTLSNFKPLDNANVTASIAVGGEKIQQTLEAPVRPGIYKFILKPAKTGAGKLVFDIETKDNKYRIISDIVVYNDEHNAIHIAEKKQIDNANAISFTKEQSWKIDFATVYPSKEKFGKVIKTTAQLLPDQTKETIITAKTNGIIKLEGNLLAGQELTKDKALFVISGKGLASENLEVRFREAKNNYDVAKADYERKLALSKNQIVSEREVENSKANYENSKAVFDNLKNNFNEHGQVVAAPKDGVIKHVYVKNGQYVEAGDLLFTLTSNNELIVKAEIQQKDYPLLNSISTFNIRSHVNNSVYTKDDLNGILLSYGKSIDEDEGYLIPVNFKIDSKKDLLMGSFIDIFIKTKSNNETIVVPNTSLVEEYGNYFVLVQLNPEMFVKREVKIGASDGIDTEIIEGLNETERVVSKGAIIVKLAAVSNSLDPHAGHVH